MNPFRRKKTAQPRLVSPELERLRQRDAGRASQANMSVQWQLKKDMLTYTLVKKFEPMTMPSVLISAALFELEAAERGKPHLLDMHTLGNHINDGIMRLAIAQEGATLHGVALSEVSNEYEQLVNWFVKPRYREIGIGQRLLKELGVQIPVSENVLQLEQPVLMTTQNPTDTQITEVA